MYKYRQPVVVFDWDKFAHKVLVGNVTCDIVYIDIYYVRETERGMMPADSELTKQLSSHTLLKNSIKFK